MMKCVYKPEERKGRLLLAFVNIYNTGRNAAS
jgi:hypothetical protein